MRGRAQRFGRLPCGRARCQMIKSPARPGIGTAPSDSRSSLRGFASGGNRSRVSNAGGYEPRWAPDGRTLYYVQADKLLAVPLEPGAAFVPGKARELFGGLTPAVTDSGQTYAVAPTGDKFLMLRPVREGGPPEVRMILNWFDELRAIIRPAR